MGSAQERSTSCSCGRKASRRSFVGWRREPPVCENFTRASFVLTFPPLRRIRLSAVQTVADTAKPIAEPAVLFFFICVLSARCRFIRRKKGEKNYMSCHETKTLLAVFNVVFCCFVVLFDLVQGCLTLPF